MADGVPVRGMRPGALAAVPTSGPDPWCVAIVARRVSDGGLLLPMAPELLMRVELDAATVAALGGPAYLRDAFEADRRKMARGARAAGLRDHVVELDITRGHARRVWPMSVDHGRMD